MAEFASDAMTLPARSALAAHAGPVADGGVTVRELHPLAAVHLCGRTGLAEGSLMARIGPAEALWLGPGQWLALAQGGARGAPDDGPRLIAALRPHLPDALLTDMTGARTVIEVAGPLARAVLAREVALDLDPQAFPVGRSATTLAGHLTVTLWLADERPAFRLAVARSFGAELWSALTHAADSVRAGAA